ncbi:MAG: hypothetical protein EA411_13055 [Saprospirales bacterium]|nr:MAG: hypothetical protein EA411_13055 [Saprospirales bacterium]
MSLLFVSCEKDSIQLEDHIDPIETQTSEYRTSSDVDSFKLYLNQLVHMFESANYASEGDLALLLGTFDTISSSTAFEKLDSSGLIDVVELESKIDQIVYFENLLLESFSEEHIALIVFDVVGDLQYKIPERPFWDVGCADYIGIVGMPDDKCYHMYVDCREFRFFIGFDQVEDQLVPTDCPD